MFINFSRNSLSVLQDKFVDMRKSAEACLIELIRVFDVEAVMALRSLLPNYIVSYLSMEGFCYMLALVQLKLSAIFSSRLQITRCLIQRKPVVWFQCLILTFCVLQVMKASKGVQGSALAALQTVFDHQRSSSTFCD